MNRAYAVIALKSVDEKARKFSGVATTPATDRMGDIVDPKGAQFKLPIPLLWQHDAHQPIGWVRSARVSKSGIEIEGEIADLPDAGVLKDRLSEAWQSIKTGLVRGLSIGFTPKETEPIDPKHPWGAQKFLQWEWLELSAVTIAANAEASITAIKSAASGHPTRPRQGTQTKGTSMYTQEALAALQSDRQTKAARMAELKDLRKGESRRFTEDERVEFDALDAEIEDLDDEIRVTQRHVSNIKAAKPVTETRGAPYGFVKKLNDVEPKFKGEEGLKRAMCRLQSMLDLKEGVRYAAPSVIAEERYAKSNPTLVAVMKANEIAGGGTGSGEWGAELVQADTRFTGDFVDYLYKKTIFDQLPLLAVPHNVVIKGQDGAFTGYFVGESKPIPMSLGDFSTTSTVPYEAAGLTVISNRLVRDSSPAALGIIGTSLQKAVAQVVDAKFLSVDAISAGVSPAGILNGLGAISSNGGDAQSVATDLKALWAPFISANNTSGNFVFIMTPTTALALSLMKNALGQPEYPTVTRTGGTLMGATVFVGDNVGSGDVILMNTDEVWKVGDLGFALSISNETMIEQSSAPTGVTDTPTAASQAMTSMFQANSTAIKVVRPISWGKKYSTAVAFVGDAAWGSEAS